ncbi:hypothetical protein N752_19420 [Desulforamulus aquiferis]|nr:hypothetical protein N752_19420 [Desulforamulus aquiferis]
MAVPRQWEDRSPGFAGQLGLLDLDAVAGVGGC